MSLFRHIRTAASAIPAEDRPHFKRIDVSPVRYDSGAWMRRPLA
jgi:hypothetical protein